MGSRFAKSPDRLPGVDRAQRNKRRTALTITILDRVRQVASDIFAVPVQSTGADSSMDTIPAWHSMEHLNLVLAIEEKFDVHFSPEEIEGMRNLGTIAGMLEAKLRSS